MDVKTIVIIGTLVNAALFGVQLYWNNWGCAGFTFCMFLFGLGWMIK